MSEGRQKVKINIVIDIKMDLWCNVVINIDW